MNLLEQPLLRIGPADARGGRPLDDQSGGRVGVTYSYPGWCPWADAISAHEAFDEPIVFRVSRRWAIRRCWAVVDAEAETVGTISRAYVLDRWDRLLFQRLDCGKQFVGGGVLAAEWRAEGGGGVLVFHPAVRDDPFSKMLLLAAVLVD